MRRELGVFAAAVVVAAAAQAGVTYKAVTKSEGGPHAEASNMTVQAWASDGKMKIEFEQSGNPMMGKGTYIVTTDGGKTFYLVNPEEKTYAKWDMDAMLGMAGGMMKMARGMMNLSFSDPKVEQLGDEPGPTMLGMPTTHYTYRTSYTMSMKFFGMNRATKVVRDEQFWTTPKLAEEVLGTWMKRKYRTGDEQLDKLIDTEMQKVHGIPLKSVIVSTNTDEKGKSQTTTMTTEVTELHTVPVPDSTFEIPAGYTETQLMPTGQEGGSDSEQKDQSESPFSKMFGGKKKG